MKNKQLILILSAAVLVVVLFIFKDNLKNLFSKKETTPGNTNTGGTKNTGGTTTPKNTGSNPTPPVSTSLIGKTVIAVYNGVRVYNKDMSVYKTAAASEWLGTVSKDEAGTGELAKYLELGGLRYVAKVAAKVN